MTKADLPYYLTSFLSKYLPGEKNASPHTIQSYSYTFKLLLTFFEGEKSIAPERLSMMDLSRDAIVEFLDWLETSRNCRITTRNQRLVAIHSFVRFVQKQSPENLFEFQRVLNIPDKKCAKTVVPFLTGNEMRILLSMPDPSDRNGLTHLSRTSGRKPCKYRKQFFGGSLQSINFRSNCTRQGADAQLVQNNLMILLGRS